MWKGVFLQGQPDLLRRRPANSHAIAFAQMRQLSFLYVMLLFNFLDVSRDIKRYNVRFRYLL